MARHVKPVPASILTADDATVKALQSIAEYQPVNPAYSTAQLLQIQATLTQAQQAEKAAEVALAQARSVRAETSHFYHDSVVGARTQVMAQFGPDATAIALVGMTRKSERKQPIKRKTVKQ